MVEMGRGRTQRGQLCSFPFFSSSKYAITRQGGGQFPDPGTEKRKKLMQALITGLLILLVCSGATSPVLGADEAVNRESLEMGLVANVRQHGATGNGSADDTFAIRKALESGAGSVYFPAGVYRVTGQLTVPRSVHVFGDGVDVSVVTAQGADPKKFPRSVLYFGGGGFSWTEQFELAADLRRFDTEIALKWIKGLRPDDVIVIINPRDFSYSGYRKYYNAGEYTHVNDVKGDKALIVGSIQADYKAGEVKLYRMVNPTRSSIRAMTIIGTGSPDDDATSCIEFQCGRGVSVRDVRLCGAHYALLTFRQCFGAQAENVEGDQIFSCDHLSGLNYGIVISNSQDVRVVNCRLIAMRHAVAVGGSGYSQSNPNPVNRQISVSNCDLKTTCNFHALDAHGNTELYTFEDNRVHGGIDFGGTLGRIIGNDIYGKNSPGVDIALYATEWKGTDFEIRNNRIHTVTTTAFQDRGAIFLTIGPRTVAGGPTIVAGNRVFVSGNLGDCRGLRAINNGSDVDWILIIDQNDFYATDYGHHILAEVQSGRPFEALIIRNNTIRNGDELIKENAARHLVFTGNWPRTDRLVPADDRSK